MTLSSETETATDAEVSFRVPPFAASCYEAAAKSWTAACEHPFLTSLLDGSLAPEFFRFYQMQDARDLEAYADACSLISVRMDDPENKLWFIDAARLALVVERELHAEYGRKLGYSPQDVARLVLTPNNRAYQNHLLTACTKGTLLEAVAALAPCPWLYAEVGRSVSGRLSNLAPDHPYADWLRTYADPAFVTYTNELLFLLEYLAERHPDEEHRSAAKEAFQLSTRYEFMFWDQAWTLQGWPPTGDSTAERDRAAGSEPERG